MKKFITLFTIAALILASCKKTELQLNNPNNPTPDASLKTKIGVEEFGLGIFAKWIDAQGNNAFTHALTIQSILGDEEWTSVGNFGMRYVNQVNTITLPNGTVVKNIFGVTQQAQMKSLNTLATISGSGQDAYVWEWSVCYYINGQANTLLQSLASSAVPISTTERSTLQAWAYWWKGVAYSRLGSMYLSGIINNAADGTTNSNYVTHDALITEANSNFNKAIALLGGLTDGGDYSTTLTAIIPSFNVTAVEVTPAMWIRDCYTYEARNYLANHKVATMTAADWTTISALAAKGLVQGDQTFVFGMDPNGLNDLTFEGIQGHPYVWNAYNIDPGWNWISERFYQDFKPNDVRRAKGITPLPAAAVTFNRSSRGIQFGTRWYPTQIEKGGYWSSDTKQGQLQFAGSWEENALMLAEANIRTGSIETGLGYIDQVRTAQGAGLPAVKGTGLLLAPALEELRTERRVALFLRGLAFYDARRLGITAPASAGGGRAGAIVLVPNTLLPAGGAGYTALPCFMDYSYADYWDIPANEISFNAPASGSAAVAN